MSSRLAAVLSAGVEAFGHDSDATGAPQPSATRRAARARWGNDWWKTDKDARLAQLGREGYKVEQPKGPYNRPQPRGPKPGRPKWDDDYSSDEEAAPARAPGPVGRPKKGLGGLGARWTDPGTLPPSSDEEPAPAPAMPNGDMARVAYMRRLNAEAAAKHNLIAEADKQAPEDMQLAVYYHLFSRTLDALEDEFSDHFADEGSNFTGLGEAFEDLTRKQWDKLYNEFYPQVAMLMKEKGKALQKLKDSKQGGNLAALRAQSPWSGITAMYKVCVPAMKEVIGEVSSSLEELDSAQLLAKLDQFAQTYAALITSAEAMVYPQALVMSGLLESETAPRLKATNEEMAKFLEPEYS